MATQRDIAAQMIAQLRLLDPSISADLGTPERKILDTVAQALYDSQVDLAALQQGLDVDSKYGAALDRFLAIFGFDRQKPTFATGYVTFSRTTPSVSDIRIPANSSLQAVTDPNTDENSDNVLTNVPFVTLFEATLVAGALSVTVPVRCTVAGEVGNVGIGQISKMTGSNPIYGISSVTNEQPTTGGIDSETDDEYKVRFKNTVFRNLAGTQDQYLALAVATAFTSKANVVGPLSTYREYVQVPPVDDASSYDPSGGSSSYTGNGNAGEYTTTLSTIPYAKYVYATEQPVYLTNGQAGIGQVFYRQDVDFTFNGKLYTGAATNDPIRYRGDTYRYVSLGYDTAPIASDLRPNITFRNIYSGTNASVQAIRPGDVVLVEFSYMSQASRSDQTLGIFNTVDVYIDGGNLTSADTVVSWPITGNAFVDLPSSMFHYENYRRVGQPEKRPMLGNVFQPLFWQPVTDLPDQIVVGTNTYNKGEHYWAVEDISNIGGTVRSRNGIEWSTKLKGQLTTDAASPPSYSGQIITVASPDTTDSFEIDGYTYDRNIYDLQASLVGSKQITTDVLAHRARTRYFKLDITVMYTPGYSVSDTNNQINFAVNQYLQSQYFGSAIQLSDLLQVIHAIPGVDNVRWTADTQASTLNLPRIIECDRFGVPLLNVTTDRNQWGNNTVPEIQYIFLQGNPKGGSWALSVPSAPDTVGGARVITSTFTYNTSQALIQSALDTSMGSGKVQVVEDPRSTTGVRVPARSFKVTFLTGLPTPNVPRDLILPSFVSSTGTALSLTGGPYMITADFFLRDDELASLPDEAYTPSSGIADSAPGLIIRPRAQNTWTRTR